MQRVIINDIEIMDDGRTVWVNNAASNIGRFSRWGVDVHTTLAAQMAGAGECLACTHGQTHLADWRGFQSLMREHHGVDVTDRHMPESIRSEL